MKIVRADEEQHKWKVVTLMDGRSIADEEIEEEEKRRGKELKVKLTACIDYRSPIGAHKGTMFYQEVE